MGHYTFVLGFVPLIVRSTAASSQFDAVDASDSGISRTQHLYMKGSRIPTLHRDNDTSSLYFLVVASLLVQ